YPRYLLHPASCRLWRGREARGLAHQQWDAEQIAARRHPKGPGLARRGRIPSARGSTSDQSERQEVRRLAEILGDARSCENPTLPGSCSSAHATAINVTSVET